MKSPEARAIDQAQEETQQEARGMASRFDIMTERLFSRDYETLDSFYADLRPLQELARNFKDVLDELDNCVVVYTDNNEEDEK